MFTPGELLKIALAACSGMASDIPLSRYLGTDYPAIIAVSGQADRAHECYRRLAETLELELSGLTEAETLRAVTVAHRAVDTTCTVGRTLRSGTEVTFEVVSRDRA